MKYFIYNVTFTIPATNAKDAKEKALRIANEIRPIYDVSHIDLLDVVKPERKKK